MSSLHIPSWTPGDIANWIRGLDGSLEQYIINFLNHEVTGERLLRMTIQELEDIQITKMGHQELILEAIDLLSLAHYAHPTETLQSVALSLNCKATNLANLLKQREQSGNQPKHRLYCTPSTILLRISETISAAKTLISWLDRPPFSNGPEKDFQEFSKEILQYALDMTQAVQKHTDITGALPEISAIAQEFAAIADNLIKQSTDPLVIQPTTIEEVRIKKKRPEEELGLFIKTSTIDGIHYITGTKDQSPASQSRKIGSGDELLRVNDQTVVAWEHSKVVTTLRADPMGTTLTLRKRPCNLGSPGQVLRPSNSPYTMRHGGTPQRMRKDSFPSMRSPVMKEEFLMPMSPNDLLITKQRSNSDPETQVETHVTHSDSESLLQEAERIKRQRRGTMGEGLQRKESKGQTAEGRPRSLPINTEELEAEVALWKASPISARPGFSPIAGSPVSPAATSSTQTSPTSQSDKTPSRTSLESATSATESFPSANQNSLSTNKKLVLKIDAPCLFKSESGIHTNLNSPLLKPLLAISKPSEDIEDFDDEKTPVPRETSLDFDQYSYKKEETESQSESLVDPIPNSESQNINNNVATGSDGDVQLKILKSDIVVTDVDDYVFVDTNRVISPAKTVSFFERHQSISPSLASEISTASVRLRPKKTRKMKYKVTRGVSCVDLGPGECQGWLYKKSESKQTFRSNWVEMWFVLKDFVLYYYKSKTDIKAKGVLCLPGYIISEAPETKRENAFKANHKGTKPIYFATRHKDDRDKWMGKLGLAAIMYSDEKRMRQSVLLESVQPSFDIGAMMQSVDGYHSESDDEEKSRGSDQSNPTSPTSSNKSEETSSETESPQHRAKMQRSQTEPLLISQSDESGTLTALPKLYLRKTKESIGSGPNSPKGSPKIMQRMINKLRRHSRGSLSIEPSELGELQGKYSNQRRNSTPFDDAPISPSDKTQTPTVSVTLPSSPEVTDIKPSQEGAAGTASTASGTDDALLDHYMSLVEDTGCVSGLDRTPEARSSRRFKAKSASRLKRIHTILDRDPEKNKKALQRRALQRTLKAKQEELEKLTTLLSQENLSSAELQKWQTSHSELLEHVLKGPKPDSPSDSDSDPDVETEQSEERCGDASSKVDSPGTETAEDVNFVETKQELPASATDEKSQNSPSPHNLDVSKMSDLPNDNLRARSGSEASETSL